MHHQHGGAAGGGNRYQTNWQYGYTLGPPSESTNGNYQFYNSRRQQQQQHQQGQQQQQYQNYHGGAGAAYATGGTQAKSNNIHINAGSSSSGYGDWSAPAGGQQYSRPSGYGSGGRTQAHQEPKSWAQIKPKPDPSMYISKVFVTASSSSTTNTSPTETAGGSSSLIGPKKPTGENGEDLGGPGCTACSQLHSLAVFNQLVEKYDSVVEPGAGFLVTLTLGNETYSGRGSSIGAGKQNAAMQALSQTQYKNRQTMKPRPQGITPTSELHELATKKAVTLDFVFLEPYLFNIKAVKGWSKNEARGQYKVQLTVGGETPLEFIGEGEFPQQAKHNAAIKAIPAVRSLPDAKATAKVVSAPPAVATVAATEGAAAESNPSGFKVENVKNVVMLINEIAVSHGLAIEWEMLSANGPPHMKSYTCQLKVGTHECVGNGNSKKNAKAQAALNMMTVISWDEKTDRDFPS